MGFFFLAESIWATPPINCGTDQSVEARFQGGPVTEEQKKKLEQKLWDIANELRGRMDADEFRDYILGFIFYK